MRFVFQDRLFLISLSAGFIANIILWVLIVGKFHSVHGIVPLHFNPVYGIDVTGNSSLVYELPGAGLAVIIVNLVLGRMIYNDYKLFAYFLIVAATAIQVLLILAATSLISINV